MVGLGEPNKSKILGRLVRDSSSKRVQTSLSITNVRNYCWKLEFKALIGSSCNRTCLKMMIIMIMIN